jgi:hypothetical protein
LLFYRYLLIYMNLYALNIDFYFLLYTLQLIALTMSINMRPAEVQPDHK